MQKSPLLNVILFFCLILIGSVQSPISSVFAAGPGCILIGGNTNNLAPSNFDFNRILFNAPIDFEYKGCIRPVGMGEYVSDGWAWNQNLGWLSLAARIDPQNPTRKLNSGVVVNSNFEYGVNIEKKLVNGKPVAKLLGYIWGDNAGWIKMNCERDDSIAYDSDHCNTQQYGVEVDFAKPVKGLDDYYYLKGYAWNSHYGYIDFKDVAIAVPDVNYDFFPVIESISGDGPKYANGSNTDQQIILKLFSKTDPKKNVSQFFHASPFKFCLIFDDQRTINGVDRFTSDLDLDINNCENHRDDFLNVLGSDGAFTYDMQKNQYVVDGTSLKSFLSTVGGDLNVAYLKMYSDDPSINPQFFPISDVSLVFDTPYEVYISKGDFDSFDQVRDAYREGVEFDYNSDLNTEDDFTLGVKIFRGELPVENTFAYEINLGASDNDLLNLQAQAILPDVASEEDPLPIVDQAQVVDPSFTPAFRISSDYDMGDNEFVIPLKLNITKHLNTVPDNILATSVDVNVEYPFDVSGQTVESKLMASMVRSNNFESFESFMKGFIQDRAFNSVFDDKDVTTATNYAKFKSLINRELATNQFGTCTLNQLNSNACRFDSQELIVIEKALVDRDFIKLSDVYSGVFGLNQESIKTVVLRGFDVFVDEDFTSENPFGVVVLANKEGVGGRMYVDYGVTQILNLFAYLDRNMMSVDGLEDVNLAVNDNLAEVGIGDVTESKSYNQLVFNGQLVSNNCSGCSRSSGNVGEAGYSPAKFADGRLVNDENLVLAQQEDLNLLRYSPLVLNVERENGALNLLNCDGASTGTQIGRNFFNTNNGFSLDKLCFMPERLGFDIKYSPVSEQNNFPKNKQRSFMLFYADSQGLPVFSRLER